MSNVVELKPKRTAAKKAPAKKTPAKKRPSVEELNAAALKIIKGPAKKPGASEFNIELPKTIVGDWLAKIWHESNRIGEVAQLLSINHEIYVRFGGGATGETNCREKLAIWDRLITDVYSGKPVQYGGMDQPAVLRDYLYAGSQAVLDKRQARLEKKENSLWKTGAPSWDIQIDYRPARKEGGMASCSVDVYTAGQLAKVRWERKPNVISWSLTYPNKAQLKAGPFIKNPDDWRNRPHINEEISHYSRKLIKAAHEGLQQAWKENAEVQLLESMPHPKSDKKSKVKLKDFLLANIKPKK